jgi:hypothetical protein
VRKSGLASMYDSMPQAVNQNGTCRKEKSALLAFQSGQGGFAREFDVENHGTSYRASLKRQRTGWNAVPARTWDATPSRNELGRRPLTI